MGGRWDEDSQDRVIRKLSVRLECHQLGLSERGDEVGPGNDSHLSTRRAPKAEQYAAQHARETFLRGHREHTRPGGHIYHIDHHHHHARHAKDVPSLVELCAETAGI